MIKILITGAKGQLGTDIFNLSKRYAEWQFQFIDIDELDISSTPDTVNFFSSQRFDFIVNCAAYTAVDKAESEEESAFAVNTSAVKNLIESIKHHNTRFIHISTDYVFDGSGSTPYSEDNPTNPQTVYGHSKLDGERVVLAFNKGMVIRTAWLYSSHGNNFLKSIINKGRQLKKLKVVNDQIGSPTYSKHLAEAVLKIIEADVNNKISFIPGVFNFTNSGSCSWYDFAVEIVNKTKISCNVFPVKSTEYPQVAKRPSYSVLSLEKIKSLYKLNIPNWKVGLSECLEEMNKSS